VVARLSDGGHQQKRKSRQQIVFHALSPVKLSTESEHEHNAGVLQKIAGKLLFSSVALCQTLIDRPLLLLYLLTATPA
jgi:hypothetical protein